MKRYPELFHAFVGTGQMVDFVETEVYDYNFGLKLAQQRGDTQKVAQLQQQGPPPYYGDSVVLKQGNYLLDGFAYMNDNPAINDDGWNTLDDLLSPEYGLYDKVNWALGVLDSGDIMFPLLGVRMPTCAVLLPVWPCRSSSSSGATTSTPHPI